MARRKEPETGAHETGAPDAGAESVAGAAPDVAPIPEAMAVPPQPDAPPEPAPAPPPVAPRRSGVLGPLLGGALAAIGGFALSHFNLLGLAPPDQGAALAALEDRLAEVQATAEADRAALAALQSELAPLADRLAALETAPAPAPPDLSRLDGLEDRLAAIEALPEGGDASTAALAAKLAELERRLAAQPPTANQAEVEAALARLAEAEAEAARRAEEAAAAAAATAQAAARDRLLAAVESGAGFQAELAALDDPALATALAPHVAGVATLDSLRSDFPDLARQVLDLARQDRADDGWGARIVDFLAAQTGARSVTPRDGDDPDAILSRAEFALGEERLADALAEIAALDPALRAPLDPWIARAEARLAALAVLEGR